jgi:hypothetical protein
MEKASPPPTTALSRDNGPPLSTTFSFVIPSEAEGPAVRLHPSPIQMKPPLFISVPCIRHGFNHGEQTSIDGLQQPPAAEAASS